MILADDQGQKFKESAVVAKHGFHEETPLWYYLLKEAQVREKGLRLGVPGSTIVAEVFVGLLGADPESFVHVQDWTPTLPPATQGMFTAADLLRLLPDELLNPQGDDADA